MKKRGEEKKKRRRREEEEEEEKKGMETRDLYGDVWISMIFMGLYGY